jgi:tripartite ATP-independent transporter DctM subunit
MTPEIIGLVSIGVLLFLFMLGMPVAFAMAIVGLAGFAVLNDFESMLALLSTDIFDTFSSYTLSVIPMFILMGSFAYAAGISGRLYRTNYVWLGNLRGGLTIATVMACAGFAAICGSTAATAATMGRIALPEMKKYGYGDRLSTGTVAAAGTLGILIPPSTILIIYGILTEQSIGKLFLAGIVPGVMLAGAFVVTVVVLCAINPEFGPPGPSTTFREKIRSITGIAEALILFALTIGGIFAGWFSPTQAGAIGAAGALAIGIIRRQMNVKQFYAACRDGLRTGVMVLFIITGATVFGHFMAVSNIPFALADWVGSLDIPPAVLIGLVIIVYFIGGFFMDSMALIVVTIPIFFPLIQRLQFDPIWFGVIIVLVAEMGVITPPVGVNVFVIKGIAPDVPLDKIFRGIIPFLIALILVTIIIVIFPQIATFLPSQVNY